MKKCLGIDLCELYDIPANQAFLLIEDCTGKKKVEKRKLHISNKRFLEIDFPEKSKVTVLFVNNEYNEIYTDVCEEEKDGTYKIDSILENVYVYLDPVPREYWDETKRKISEKTYSKIVYTDNSLAASTEYGIHLISLNGCEIEDSNIKLSEARFSNSLLDLSDSLVETILTGKKLTISELTRFLDDLNDKNLSVSYDFGPLSLSISDTSVHINKTIGNQPTLRESFSCFLSVKRIGGIISLFVAKVLKAESDQKLLKYLNEFLV